MPPKRATRSSTDKSSQPLAKTSGNKRKSADDATEATKDSKNKSSPSKKRAKAAASTSEKASEESPLAKSKTSSSSTKRKDATTEPTNNGGINYLLMVHLNGTFNPSVTRLLSVPASTSFEAFHEVLQIAFGWTLSHMWQFLVSRRPEGQPVNPGFLNPTGKTFYIHPAGKLAGIISPFTEQDRDAGEILLSDIFDDDEHRGKTNVIYEYDFGDSWEHDITLIGREEPEARRLMQIPAEMKYVCLTGEGHHVAEDCGGHPGWDDLKDALTKKGRSDPGGLKVWYKNDCLNGDPKGLDPWRWDLLQVNSDLHELTRSAR